MSEPSRLTPEQQAIVEAGQPRLHVSAIPGAGKTFTLVEKYLRLVEKEGLSPDEILAITFTNKAAAEMKRRIVARLAGAGLYEEAQLAEIGPIQTFHSFCERTLRENALEARLDPEFAILAPEEAQRRMDAAIREAFRIAGEEESHPVLGEFAGRGLAGDLSGSPHNLLQTTIRSLIEGCRTGGLLLEDLERSYESPEAILRLWRDAWPDVKGEKPALEAEDFLIQYRKLVRAAKQSSLAPWTNLKATPDQELGFASETWGLARLAFLAWSQYAGALASEAALDFSELESAAVHLLESSPEVRRRVARTYRVAMVDEAQDMNPAQYRLLSAIAAEQVLVVGDQRQSIYRFRQADSRLFMRHAEGAHSLRLSQNHRSQAGILAYVNAVFEPRWGENPIRIDDPKAPFTGVELWELKAKDSRAIAEAVHEMIDLGERPESIALLVTANHEAARLSAELRSFGLSTRMQGASERFYARLEIRDLANVLRALVDPLDDFSLLAALRSPFAGVSLDTIAELALQPPALEALQALAPANPEDAPLLDEFRAWFLPLRKVADRLPAWEVIAELFANSPILVNLAQRPNGEQELANVRKLLRRAAEQPSMGCREFAVAIQEIQSQKHRENSAPFDERGDAVTISTIHGAKGLEYDVVVLADPFDRLKDRKELVYVDPEYGAISTELGPTPSPYHAFFKEMRRRDLDAEAARVLFVGMTRARRRLCVCVTQSKDRKGSLPIQHVSIQTAVERGAKYRALGETAGEAPIESPDDLTEE